LSHFSGSFMALLALLYLQEGILLLFYVIQVFVFFFLFLLRDKVDQDSTVYHH
jgi:hypothetical protein